MYDALEMLLLLLHLFIILPLLLILMIIQILLINPRIYNLACIILPLLLMPLLHLNLQTVKVMHLPSDMDDIVSLFLFVVGLWSPPPLLGGRGHLSPPIEDGDEG